MELKIKPPPIDRNPKILGGTPVTRVPVRILRSIWNRIDDFLDDFPTVSRDLALAVIANARANLVGDSSESVLDGSVPRQLAPLFTVNRTVQQGWVGRAQKMAIDRLKRGRLSRFSGNVYVGHCSLIHFSGKVDCF